MNFNKNFEYQIIDNSIIILRYTGKSSVVVIPKQYKGTEITAIAKDAFEGNKFIKYVFIPKTVKTIGAFAFYNCTNLRKIVLPPIKILSKYVFAGCTNLTKITIPDTVEVLEKATFADCTKLINITLPNSVKEIGVNAFCNCVNLKTATLSTNTAYIGKYAFGWDINLKKIYIPCTVQQIEYEAFAFAENIKIFCETTKKQIGWDKNWNNTGIPNRFYQVIYNCKL